MPTPLSIINDVALDTFHASVVACPQTIDDGVTVNEEMTGRAWEPDGVVAWIVADSAEVLPVESCALTAYEYVVPAARPVSLHEVVPAAVVAKRAPLR